MIYYTKLYPEIDALFYLLFKSSIQVFKNFSAKIPKLRAR
ncbi:hypothetical protein GGR09_000005 [Bartonella heixiaziensis]